MMKRFVGLILGVVLFSCTAQARESCQNPSLTSGLQNSKNELLPYMSRYYSADIRDPRQASRTANSSVWLQRTARFNLSESPAPISSDKSHSFECNYDTAIEVLDELEGELGQDHPYLQRWADNQNRVLVSCATGQRLPVIESAEGETWPSRAAADLAYQKASILFYTRTDADTTALESAYLEQSQDEKSPMQGRAATMALRLALMNGGLGHLMDVATGLRNNPTTAKAYAYAEDTIFTTYWNYSETGQGTEDLTKRLQWLVDTALERNVPIFSTTTNIQQDFREWRRRDARYQLEGLISPGALKADTMNPGWWFSETTETDPYKESVRQIAQREPYVDYLATHFVRTPLTSWRWALYDPENPTWKNSQVIAHHALDRFCNGDGVEWLAEAARLIPPRDPEITWTRDQLVHALDDGRLNQSQPLLRANLQQQAVRLSLLAGDNEQALDILTRQDIIFSAKSGARNAAIPSYSEDHRHEDYMADIKSQTLNETLSWYAHQGQWNNVKTVINSCDAKNACSSAPLRYSSINITRPFRFMLAQNQDEVLKVLSDTSEYGVGQFSLLFDLLPTSRLVEIAETTQKTEKFGDLLKSLAPRILLRSWLLDDEGLLRRAVQVYGNQFPEQRVDVLRAFAGDSFDRALFVLRHQNNPFSSGELYSLVDTTRTKTLYNWTGLWCQFQPDDYTSASTTLWEYAPDNAPSNRSGWWYTRDNGLKYDGTKFAEARQKAFMAHPLWQLADKAEWQKLAAIPPGPSYLTNIIVSYARWPRLWNRMMGRSEDMPEALHLAIRSARFGCHRDNTVYGAESRAAYKILHRDFGKSIWSENTPYWYQ